MARFKILPFILLCCGAATAAPQCPGNYAPPPPPKPRPDPNAPKLVDITSPPRPTPRSGRPVTPPPTRRGTPAPVNPGRPGVTNPGRRGPTTPRGAPMVFTRGRSAAKRLRLDWETPVFPVKKSTGQKTAAAVDTASRAAAIKLLSGTDKRPLLVMRECHECAGTDMALLRRAGSNERTQLLTRWFHCVRLPATVRKAGHPVHALFAGKDAPHLVFASVDGSEIKSLAGNLPVSAVWKSMTKILRTTYKKDPSSAVKGLLRVLDGLDKLDAQQLEISAQIERSLERVGPKSPKFKKLKAKYEASQAKRKKLLARERKLLNLGLK